MIHANAALPNETRTMLFTAVRATTTLSLRPSLLFSASTRSFSTSICRLEQFHGADEAVSLFIFAHSHSPSGVVLTRRHNRPSPESRPQQKQTSAWCSLIFTPSAPFLVCAYHFGCADRDAAGAPLARCSRLFWRGSQGTQKRKRARVGQLISLPSTRTCTVRLRRSTRCAAPAFPRSYIDGIRSGCSLMNCSFFPSIWACEIGPRAPNGCCVSRWRTCEAVRRGAA